MIGFSFGSGRASKKANSDFSATSVATCRCWYRASLGVTDDGSGKASAWADQSGAGDTNRNLAQATSARRPTITASNANFNGRATLEWDGGAAGSGTYLDSSAFTGGVYAQAVTWYIVMRASRVSGTDTIFDSNDGAATNRNALIVTGSTWLPYAGASVTGGTPATATTYVVCIVFNGASGALYKSRYNTTEMTGSFGTQGIHSIRVGGHNSLATAHFLGSIAEIIGYSGGHNATDRQTVMEGLGLMYGVTISA